MLCQICNEQEATVHYTEIISNKVAELHLCEDCARQKEIIDQSGNFSMADLVKGFAGFVGTKDGEENLKCDNCGLIFSDFRKTGRFGCSRCYKAFQTELEPLIKRIHGSTKHVGSVVPPKHAKEVQALSKIEKLKIKMEGAIQQEAFERAAEIRDQIRKLEKGIKE
ncbi:MAG: UvrB/UvrC motif-containing protein [bacterium]|nr:UvrB/UvrC motif-containing protein [bacterium]